MEIKGEFKPKIHPIGARENFGYMMVFQFPRASYYLFYLFMFEAFLNRFNPIGISLVFSCFVIYRFCFRPRIDFEMERLGYPTSGKLAKFRFFLRNDAWKPWSKNYGKRAEAA